MEELLEVLETAQDPAEHIAAIAEHQLTILQAIQDAIPFMMIAAGLIIGIFLVMAFSSGMRNSS